MKLQELLFGRIFAMRMSILNGRTDEKTYKLEVLEDLMADAGLEEEYSEFADEREKEEARLWQDIKRFYE